MNEMQAHGLLIPVGSKPFEVWIDKNNSLAELQDLVNGNVEVLSSARTRATTTTAVAISAIRVQSTVSIQSVTNQNCMNRFKETRR